MEVHREGDRVYVGTVSSGGHRDAVARVRAVDPATGAVVASTPAYSGAYKYRAVTQDRTTSTTHGVWLLHDNGALEQRSKNLTYWSRRLNTFSPPSGATLERFCDLEQLPNREFIATGVYSVGGDLFGFWQGVREHSGIANYWYETWAHSYPIDSLAVVDEACPRVSFETNTDETVFLQPYLNDNGTTEHRVTRYDDHLEVGQWTIPVSWKWLVTDVSAEFGGIVISRQKDTYPQSAYLELFEQDTGASLSIRTLDHARAIDFALSPFTQLDGTSLLWWGGREHETGSDYELGVLGFANNP